MAIEITDRGVQQEFLGRIPLPVVLVSAVYMYIDDISYVLVGFNPKRKQLLGLRGNPPTEFLPNIMVPLAFAFAASTSVVPDFGPGFNASDAPNMNGDYVMSATPGQEKAMAKLFPKRFADWPGGAH